MADMGGLTPGRGPTFAQYAGAVRRAIELTPLFTAELLKEGTLEINWKASLITSVGKVELTLRRHVDSGARLDRALVFFSPPPPTPNESIANSQGVTVSRRITPGPDQGSMAFIFANNIHKLEGIRLAPGDEVHMLACEVAAAMLPKTVPEDGPRKHRLAFRTIMRRTLELCAADLQALKPTQD